MRWVRPARRASDRGFALVELMVVVLVIGILVAIAMPTFLGARTHAQDRATQVLLRQALLTAKTYYTNEQTYLDTDAVSTAVAYHALEPTIDFVAAPPLLRQVDIEGVDSTHVTLTSLSASGKWFCVQDNTGTGTTYGSDPTTEADAASNCTEPSW